jgi:hypothetical protein
MPKIHQKVWIAGSGIAVSAVAVVLAHDLIWLRSEDVVETISRSIDEAKARGVWVASLQAAPGELPITGGMVHINSAWIERRLQRSERILFPKERDLAGHSLCFTIAEGSLEEDYFLFQRTTMQD